MKKDYENFDFCHCDKNTSIYTRTNDFGQWDVCCNCNKPIEDTFIYLNHFDGEDHTEDWEM